MLPPTIKTAPTSEIVRPKPANTAVRTELRAIARSTRIDRDRVAPSTRNAPPYSCQGSSIARCVKAVMIGVARSACAMTIALGVKKSASAPKRPRARKKRKRPRPEGGGRESRQGQVRKIRGGGRRGGGAGRAAAQGEAGEG